MANLNYCRFENTYNDLYDVYDHLFDDELSESEDKYRKRLIKLCREISDEAFDEIVSE
jgi:hypothetical protein